MIVREANLDDALAITKVHIDTWRTTYSEILPKEYLANLSYQQRESHWKQMLSTAAENNHFIYVVENDGKIIAFANGGAERTNDPIYKGEIYAIYILKAYQRQGLGRRLIQSLVKRLDGLGLESMLVWVLADNPACKFYQALYGEQIYTKQIQRGDRTLNEIAYGWKDIRVLIAENNC
ncbi:MAG: GNAT family N-acetyltransferase [Hapalosiphonaceae cyanobacterium JJU2]|nr:MAG: GNAT family N-acetyltransferase [Hapalosiphonaceae cyanobacterium JJU2]